MSIKLNFLYFICIVIAEQIETCLYIRAFENREVILKSRLQKK
ncbi:MAG: hypothetical protein ACI9OE_002625 [Mariniflexile sp.]|jgi:hypothetical protein